MLRLLALDINPLHVLHIHIPIWNPFEWFNNQIHDLYLKEASLFEGIFFSPPNPVNKQAQDYINANTFGLAWMIAIWTFVILAIASIFWPKKFGNWLNALKVAVVIGVLGPFFYAAVDWCQNASHDTAMAIKAMFESFGDGHNTGGFLNQIPDITNIIGSVIGLGAVSFFGSVLTLLFILMSLYVVFFKAAAPVTYAFYPIGKRAENAFNWMLSLGIVFVLFALPAAVTALEIGKLAIREAPFGNTAFGASVYLCATMALAFLLIVWIASAVNSKVSQVMGDMKSRVTGQVKSELKNRKPLHVKTLNKSHLGGLGQPVPAYAGGGSGNGAATNMALKRLAGSNTVGAAAVLLRRPSHRNLG